MPVVLLTDALIYLLLAFGSFSRSGEKDCTRIMSIDYDQDFFAWSQEQARLLQSGRFSQLDVAHLVEEIGDLGKRERRALESRLAVLIGHLLKWRYRPDYPNRKSWRATINTQRRAVTRLLDENPSLRAELEKVIAEAYPDAVDLAVAETPFDYDAFPKSCPWDEEQILKNYWPIADQG